jgi:hypothetical protein
VSVYCVYFRSQILHTLSNILGTVNRQKLCREASPMVRLMYDQGRFGCPIVCRPLVQ